MIFRLNVYYRYKPKKRVYRYAYGDIYKGGHNDVVYAFIKERYLFSSMSAKKITKKNKYILRVTINRQYAFVHTHPHCILHEGEEFSPEDKSLVNKYGMFYCYLGTPLGKLLRYGTGKVMTIATGLPKARRPEGSCRIK